MLNQSASGLEFLLIHRSERHGDPWSGQMALPGGRRQPEDPDLLATSIRETREEVGLDLHRYGRALAALDEIQAVSRGARIDLIISPFVHAIDSAPPDLKIDPAEVQSALWVPLRQLIDPVAQTTFHYDLGGRKFEFPAYAYRGYKIWGLTYRILSQFIEVTAHPTGSR